METAIDYKKEMQVSTSKKFKSDSKFKRYQHCHRVTHVDAISDESFECMECMARFELSDHLLQHLDTHQTAPSMDQFDLECSICSYAPYKQLQNEMMNQDEG